MEIGAESSSRREMKHQHQRINYNLNTHSKIQLLDYRNQMHKSGIFTNTHTRN